MGRTTARTLALVLLLLLATGLRFYRLDAQSLWNDEGNAARAAERTIPLILAAAEGDIHPPGYYLLLHFWRALAGESEFALRALSAFCGVLTVAFTYALGRRLLGGSTGLGAAFLAALSPLAVYYSQEARMYALLGLLATASTCFLCDMRYAICASRLSPIAHRGSGVVTLAGYVTTAAAGLYTHYAFPFVLAVHNLLFLGWWWVRGRRGSDRWRLLVGWAILQATALLLFLPWLPTALQSVTGWSSAGRGYDLGLALQDVFHVLTVGITLEAGEARWALLIAGGLLLAGLWTQQERAGAVGGLAAWLLLPIALIFAFDLYKPAYLKFLVAVLSPFHILLAYGVESVANLARHATRITQYVSRVTCYVLRVACYVSLLVTALIPSLHNLYFNPTYARNDYRQIAADVAASARPGDGIILNAANQWEVFTYYHREGAPVYPIPRSRPPRAAAVAAELEQVTAAHQRLFVLYWGDAEADPERLVEGWLANHAYKAGDRWYGRVRVAVYGLGPLPEEPAVELNAHFGGAIYLHGYALGEVVPGDILPVTLFWEAEAPVPDRYKVFLHLLDSNGQLVAQTDTEPGNNLVPTSIWTPGEALIDRYGVFLPQDLPAGEYALVVGLYHLVTVERLPVTLDGAPAGDHVILGTVAIPP